MVMGRKNVHFMIGMDHPHKVATKFNGNTIKGGRGALKLKDRLEYEGRRLSRFITGKCEKKLLKT